MVNAADLIYNREGIQLVNEERRQRAQQQAEEGREMMRQSKLYVTCPMLGKTAPMKDRCRVIEENAQRLKTQLQVRREFLDDYSGIASGMMAANPSPEDAVQTHEREMAMRAGQIRRQLLFGEHADRPGGAAENARAMLRPSSAPPGKSTGQVPSVRFVDRCQQLPTRRKEGNIVSTVSSEMTRREPDAVLSQTTPRSTTPMRPSRPSSAFSASLLAVAPRPVSSSSRPFSASSLSSRTRVIIENANRNQQALQSHGQFLREEVEYRQRIAADLELLKAANSQE